MPDGIAVLDPVQLGRIESLHRGFLYQHLFAVGCLLLAKGAGVGRVVVEGDEDVELALPNRHVYGQVKTRLGSLTYGDTKSALERFEAIRQAHSTGARRGVPAFVIISSAEPGPELAARIKASSWPSDVAIRHPGSAGSGETCLPPAWPNLPSAVAWLSERAAELPFAMLNPETLVWKLAGRVQLACSGTPPHENHAFDATDLPQLFEQLVVSLQDLPLPPNGYRPQQGEPPLVGEARVRLVSGFSGSGKTAWASEAALHASSPVVYFDVGDMSGPVIAMSLARELAARLYGKRKGELGEILLPGASGMELLRALDRRLEREGVDVLVVLDNTHKARPDDLASLVQPMGRMKFLLLCQPGEVAEYMDKVAGVPLEVLKGWDADAVAAEAESLGCKANFAASEQLRKLTGGLPLYVQGALRVAASGYGGDVAKFCADVESLNHTTTTPQEIVLAKMFEALPDDAQDVAGLLSLADTSVTRDEATALVAAGLSDGAKMLPKAARLLSSAGALLVFGDGRLKVHDAVRVLGKARLDNLGEEAAAKARKALRDALSKSLVDERDPTRLAQFVKLLGETGEVETVVDLAGHEFFHEVGLTPEFRDVLHRAAYDSALPPEKRFWALDALAFTELRDDDLGSTPKHLKAMRDMVDQGALGDREKLELASKAMLLAAKLGDKQRVFEALEEATSTASAKSSGSYLVSGWPV
ncbi:MAG: ATP-binding protein [Planctomycetota bacterium]|nr:ATP-binding protein [Planctomycetota bacterium]